MNGGFILPEFFDVSQLINEEMVVYPGNPEPSIKRYASVPKDRVNESILTLGSHTGTHVDSRLHLRNGRMGLHPCLSIAFTGNAGLSTLSMWKKRSTDRTLKGFK